MRLIPRRPFSAAKRVVVVAVAGVLALFAAGVLLHARDVSGQSPDNVAKSTALLLKTIDWDSSLAEVRSSSFETVTHEDILTKDVYVIRRWHTPGRRDGFELRQDVQTQPDGKAAHEAYVDADPGPEFREDLGGADPLSTAAAPHADEAIGYCVPQPTGCFILHYTLRYGPHVIDLSLIRKDADRHSAEELLSSLDRVVAERLA